MTRRIRIELGFLAVVLLVCWTLTGCTQASEPSASLPPGAVSQVQAVRGTIPGLELVDVSSLPADVATPIGYWADAGSKPDSQPSLKKGSYKAILSSDHIAEAQVTVAKVDGINRPALLLTLDAAGAKVFTDYSAANEGKQMAVVLNGLVIGVPIVEVPATPGVIQLNLGTEQMDAVKAAIVPAK